MLTPMKMQSTWVSAKLRTLLFGGNFVYPGASQEKRRRY